MARFRRGRDAMMEAATRTGGGRFTPTLRWEKDEEKYIQFLMSIEDVPTVLMHQWIITGKRENGDDQYDHFISRRDPDLDGPKGWDDLIDRFEQQPTQRCIALATELKPVVEKVGGRNKVVGFEIEERQFENSEGETVSVPAFGLIIESPFTFFKQLAPHADEQDINEVIFKVVRQGGGTDTSYTFIPQSKFEVLDLEEELEAFEFDFDAYLDELADEDRMREIVDAIPDGAKVSRFPSKGKGKGGKGKSEGSRSTRSRRQAADDDSDDSDDSDEADAAPDEDDAPRRRRRFQDLKEETEEKPKRRTRS